MADVTAVTFDMWETLITDPPEVSARRDAERIARMAALLGLASDRLAPALDGLRRHLTKVQLAEGDMGTAAQLGWLLLAVGGPRYRDLSPAQQEELAAAYVEPLFDYPPLPMPGAAALLHALAAAGVPAGLICNTGFTPGSALRRLLDRMGMLDYFGALYFSGDVGVSKPAARAFHDTLAQLGATPAATVHIGDNPGTDVAGAKRAGLRAVLLHRRQGEPPADHGADLVVRSLPEFGAYLGLHA